VALFDRNDIEKSFSKTIVIRGADYLRTGQVIDAWIDADGDLCGRVQGSEPEPYEVTIQFVRRSGFIELDSGCTCPFSLQCKHGAALAFYALKHELKVALSDRDESQDDERETNVEFRLPKAPPVSSDIPLPKELTDWLRSIEIASRTGDELDPSVNARVFYVLDTKSTPNGFDIPIVTPVTRTALKSGGWGVRSEVKNTAISAYNAPKGWTSFDCSLIGDLHVNAPRVDHGRAAFRLDGKHGTRLLLEIIRSERCTWREGAILKQGAVRSGSLAWEETGKKGQVKPQIAFEGIGFALATSPPWYVDTATFECGPLECGVSADLAGALLRGGAIAPEHVLQIRTRLQELGLEGDALPSAKHATQVRAPEPVPRFAIDFESCQRKVDYWSSTKVSAPVAFGKLTFEYDGHRAPVDGSDIRVVAGDEILIIRRNPQAESIARDFLDRCGWDETRFCGWEIPTGRGTSLCIVPPDTSRLLEPLERVSAFVQKVVPKLKSAGWKIDIDQNYRFVPDDDIEWNVGLDGGSGIDWFEFQLGIRVEGEPYDLRPVLATLFKEHGNSAHHLASVARSQKSDDLFIFGNGGQVIRLSRKRLSAILQPLIELFGGVGEWPDDLRLPKSLLPEAGRFQETLDAEGVPWKSDTELAHLNSKFAAFDHLEPMNEPEGFVGELRSYQKEGLAWLQFLREFGFGGVLADDMGLGKTVQVLAHIQAEKNSGRMDRPCLIVAPTSTIPNWRRECERFVPNLKVLTLQGAGRSGRFAEIDEVDIALTTYPLLARDKGPLLNSSYHIVVLDEAQNVKNPATGAAKAARDLKGRHKICMSGTPVENHLSELWSLFHFLMPGFLGSDAEFKKRFRTPIEKLGDNGARDRLARRIRPFMLRRTKGQVVKELPPKTEIIETIAFEDGQRDLYESIRMAMDENVRNLIAVQGFDKSRIQILDALLKLRQVCCDPRLVKLPSARSVTESAKLDRLLEMLGVLLEDGRKVLLFSQFTSMLNLIEERLKAENMRWVRISGDTIDRETPVTQFQAGEVPLFLISLKAGGTGLNLTAADTVILYDPWWNPAVENQAIDRAHRIGQDKAVIVYKLVASGTIEEKMLEMQKRKGDIAKSILTDDAEGIRTLTADDLRWVLSKD